MAASLLYDLLKKEIKKMVSGASPRKKGNIYPLVMQEVERYIIMLVLEETAHNLVVAAHVLGISRSTLYRKIQALNISLEGVVHDEKPGE